MKIVLKYLNPTVITLCVILLFGQALSDLSLPNLMSGIVNYGIQRSGVTENAPKVISEASYNTLKLCMSETDMQILDKSYTFSTPDSELSKKLERNFPQLAKVNAYILTENAKEALAETEAAYARTSYEMASSTMEISDDLNSQAAIALTRSLYIELGADMTALQQKYIIFKGMQMLAVAFAGVAAAAMVGLISSQTATRAAQKIRRDVFSKVESFSLNEFDKFSTASLITRTTNDIQQVQMLILMGMRLLFFAPIMGVGGIVMALNKSVSMSWVIALSVICIIGLIMILYVTVMPKFRMTQKLTDRLNLVSRENLSGMMVIRAFGNQEYEEKRFEKAARDLRDTERFTQRAMAFMMPTMALIMNMVSLSIIWVGGKAVSQSSLQIGDMMAFMQYAMQIIMSFLMISIMFIMIPRASVSANRIAEVLDTDLSIIDSKVKKCLPANIKGEVSFNNVSFRYKGAESNALTNISFTARSGQTTAFIGSTGSGKSTLINLVPRFYDVTEGSIEIDGINIKDVSQHELREAIGYAPQKGSLFSGDVESNIAYGLENADSDEILKVLEIAQAKDFAELKMPISQGGENVSGGQRQRLAIARALVKKPSIYIFDDSFSALDFKTDRELRKSLKEFTGGSTILIVAQRVSTVMNAEQIIVLDEGRIIGVGTHKELLESCAPYREIAESQLAKGEL